jgi:hypothetical protein
MPHRPGFLLTHFHYFVVSEAVDRMVIDHAHCLHKSVNDGGTDEVKTPVLQILADLF